jgi:hypothetical protein
VNEGSQAHQAGVLDRSVATGPVMQIAYALPQDVVEVTLLK